MKAKRWIYLTTGESLYGLMSPVRKLERNMKKVFEMRHKKYLKSYRNVMRETFTCSVCLKLLPKARKIKSHANKCNSCAAKYQREWVKKQKEKELFELENRPHFIPVDFTKLPVRSPQMQAFMMTGPVESLQWLADNGFFDAVKTSSLEDEELFTPEEEIDDEEDLDNTGIY